MARKQSGRKGFGAVKGLGQTRRHRPERTPHSLSALVYSPTVVIDAPRVSTVTSSSAPSESSAA